MFYIIGGDVADIFMNDQATFIISVGHMLDTVLKVWSLDVIILTLYQIIFKQLQGQILFTTNTNRVKHFNQFFTKSCHLLYISSWSQDVIAYRVKSDEKSKTFEFKGLEKSMVLVGHKGGST